MAEINTLNIIQKVNEIFLKYGIKSVSMDDIARELGISKKTLYQYFTDKADLVSKVIDYQIDDKISCFGEVIDRKLNAIEELLEIQRLLNAFVQQYNPAIYYDLKKYYPELYQKLSHNRRQRMLDILLQNLEKGKQEGVYRAELNNEIIANIYISRVEILHGQEDLISFHEMHNRQVLKEVIIYHLRGICNANGYAILEKLIDKHFNEPF